MTKIVQGPVDLSSELNPGEKILMSGKIFQRKKGEAYFTVAYGVLLKAKRSLTRGFRTYSNSPVSGVYYNYFRPGQGELLKAVKKIVKDYHSDNNSEKLDQELLKLGFMIVLVVEGREQTDIEDRTDFVGEIFDE